MATEFFAVAFGEGTGPSAAAPVDVGSERPHEGGFDGDGGLLFGKAGTAHGFNGGGDQLKGHTVCKGEARFVDGAAAFLHLDDFGFAFGFDEALQTLEGGTVALEKEALVVEAIHDVQTADAGAEFAHGVEVLGIDAVAAEDDDVAFPVEGGASEFREDVREVRSGYGDEDEFGVAEVFVVVDGKAGVEGVGYAAGNAQRTGLDELKVLPQTGKFSNPGGANWSRCDQSRPWRCRHIGTYSSDP